jgi:hypothetical protein
MATYRAFTSPRMTVPHFPTLITQLREIDPTMGVQTEGLPGAPFRLKRTGDVEWTPGDVQRAQQILDTCPEHSPALVARHQIETLEGPLLLVMQALVDELNQLRTRLNLPVRNWTDVLSQARAKSVPPSGRV